MATLAQSVGRNGKNKPVDVIKVQNLINNNDLYTGLTFALPVTGIIDDALIAAIKCFQHSHPDLKQNKPDGRVDPGGKTLVNLNKISNKASVCRSYLPVGFDSNRLIQCNTDKLIELYELQYNKLGAVAKLGLRNLMDYFYADTEVTDIRWVAYMLATVKHECANTWQPIEEYGKGAGRDYGKAVKVPDPTDATGKKTLSNIYYGRGYVQLTWESNYKKMDAALGITGDSSLHRYPANALNSSIAYRIMSYGMRNGSFTGKKLTDYIIGGTTDYYNARKIINGVDMAELIKGYAENIEFLLRFCNGVPL